jgi:hypothetical protein
MDKLTIGKKIGLKFTDAKEFIGAVVKNPKILTMTGLMFVGAKQLSSQELVGIRDLSITPLMEPTGHSIHTNTFFLQNLDDKTQDFLQQSLEYRYGGEFKGKKLAGTYNVGVEVGSNNLMINNKLVSDKLYEQIHLVLGLSKIFNTPISINIGYSQRLGNYYFDGMQFTGNIKAGRSGTGGVINIKGGKITSYEGIQEVTFGKKFTGALRFYNETGKSMKDAYYNIYGIVDMSSSKYVFSPYFSIASTRENLKKGIIDHNIGIFFKPLTGKKKGRFYAYAEVGVNKNGKWSFFTRLNYRLTTPDVKASKDAALKDAYEKQIKQKERNLKVIEKQKAKQAREAKKPFRNKNFSKQNWKITRPR